MLIRQGIGGALVFVATKNVMSPGKDFAAYSAAKAAEAQLAKVLALEGAPHGIRSNIVNPDADLPGLQALVRGDPARARGRPGHRGRAARGLLPQAQPARRRASCPRTSPRPCCSWPPTARPRRPAARSPWTAASRTRSRGDDAVRHVAVAQAAGRAVRAGAARGGARLRVGVDRRSRVLPRADPRVADAAGDLRAHHQPHQARHRRSTCWPSARRPSRPRPRRRSTRCRAAG